MYINSFDELSVMNDDQLQKLFMKIRGDINRNHRRKESVFDLEIELCYIQRELFIRYSRKQAHTEYMSSRHDRKSFA